MESLKRWMTVVLLMYMILSLPLQAMAQETSETTADSVAPLSERGLENVVAFTRLLGYVRYFYAGDTAANTDWEAFALTHIAKVESAETPEALAHLLRTLFNPYAPSVQIGVTGVTFKPLVRSGKEDATAIKQWVRFGVVDLNANNGDLMAPIRYELPLSDTDDELPETSEFTDATFERTVTFQVNNPDEPLEVELGGGVSARIPLTVYVQDENTLPIGGGVEALDALDTDLQLRGVRLGTVAVTWNHFQHLYSYWDVLDRLGVDWEAALREALTAAATAENPTDYFLLMERLTAYLNDGHVRVSTRLVGQLDERAYSGGRYTLPMSFDMVEDQLVVTTIAPSYQGEIKPGDAVLSWNDQPTAKFLAEIDAMTSPVGQFGLYVSLPRRATGAQHSFVTLAVQPADGGEAFTEEVARSLPIGEQSHPFTFYREHRPEPVSALGDGIVYVDLTRMSMEEMLPALELLENAEGIVVDMRGYPCGDHPRTLMHRLAGEPLDTAPFLIPIFTQPDLQGVVYIDASSTWINPVEPRLTDNVAWIINANGAVSYAESIMGIVERGTLGAIVGQPTAGVNGNVARLNLVAGFEIVYTSMRVEKHDGTALFTVGVTPTIPVERTIAGVAAGRDELLEAAFATVGGKTLDITAIDISDASQFDANTITMIPFTDETGGFTTVIPESWTQSVAVVIPITLDRPYSISAEQMILKP